MAPTRVTAMSFIVACRTLTSGVSGKVDVLASKVAVLVGFSQELLRAQS